MFPACLDIFSASAPFLSSIAGAFLASLKVMIIMMAAAVPWVVFLFFMAWLALKFLRFWVRRRREMKKKNDV